LQIAEMILANMHVFTEHSTPLYDPSKNEKVMLAQESKK